MKHRRVRRTARAILAGLTVVAFAIPTMDGLVCSMNATRTAEMHARHHQTVNHVVHAPAGHRCAHMSCCRGRTFTAGVPAMPFVLGLLPATQEPSATPSLSSYVAFLPPSLPPPRG